MSLSPLQMMGQPPSVTYNPSFASKSGDINQSVSQSSGAFNFGGSSVSTPLMVVAAIVAAIFILKRK